MAANILRSDRAIQVSVFVVRAFIKMRGMLAAQEDLARKLAELDKRLTERLDVHEHAISDIIKQIMALLTPSPEPEPPLPPPRPKIGFHVSEPMAKYRAGRARKASADVLKGTRKNRGDRDVST